MSDEQQQDMDRTPIQISAEFRQMIDDEVRQIEQQGGITTDKLKAGLYEKWVSELLDTIAAMCKHTVELEKVATSSVAKLEQKLLESASATHNFMHSTSNRLTSTKLRDSGLGTNSGPGLQTTEIGFSHGYKEPLVQRLQESQESLQKYLERCNDLQQTIDKLEYSNRELEANLAQKEESLINLSSEKILTEQLDAGVKARLQAERDEKVLQLAQETSQRKKLEKRVFKQSEEIKALTQEVAAKHDQALQQEQKTREALQQSDKLQTQINYQTMLTETLRKEVRKLKSGLLNSKNTTPHGSRENLSLDNKERDTVQVVVEHHTETDDSVEKLVAETSLRKKMEKRVCKQSEEIKALTQEVAAKHDHALQQEQRTREVLIQKDKLQMQINYQTMLIESLRKDMKKLKNNTFGSKNSSPYVSRENLSFESKEPVKELQESSNQAPGRAGHDAEMNRDQEVSRLQQRLEVMEATLKAKDDIISTIQAAAGPSRSQNLAHIHKMSPDELKHSLLNKEKEISEQRTLIGQLQEALISSKNKFDELQRDGDHSEDMLYSAAMASELSKDLHESKRQLKFYEEHNRDLSLEVMRIRNDKTESELYLEGVVKQRGEHLAEKEAELERLQSVVQQGGDHSNCALQIATLQKYVDDGAKMLREKSDQIMKLKCKLDEMCREAEEQLKMMTLRNSLLAHLEESLGSVSTERDALLLKVKSLNEEVQFKDRQQSNVQSDEKWRRLLKGTEDELESWRKRYEIINTNLEQKELLINEMRRRHEEEMSQAMAQTVDLDKLAQLEAEASELKSQLALCKIELSTLRTKCEQKSAEVVELRRQLDLETARSRENKAEAQKCATHAEEQLLLVQNLQRELDTRGGSHKAKEDEMKRLLRLSCENVEHLQDLNMQLSVRAEAAERFELRVLQLEAATKEAHGDLEVTRVEADRLRGRLEAAEREAADAAQRLAQFEHELVLSAERVLQLQGMLTAAQHERQQAADEAAAIRDRLAADALEHQSQQAQLTEQLHAAQIEKQQCERGQKQMEDLCKTLSAQLGGQKKEREKYLRGLKQAAVERSQMCQEARQVLSVAREWMSEHRASAMELRQLKTERERLLKENNGLRHRSRTSTSSVLNSWDCGLVDREESGFWSSHWTTQLDEVDQEIETFRRRTESWGDMEEDDDDCEEPESRGDNGYQSGSSK